MSDSDRPTSDGPPRDTVEAVTPVGWDIDEDSDARQTMLPGAMVEADQVGGEEKRR